jgi:hypothetical protein
VAIGFAQTSSFLLFFGDSRISPFSLLITPYLKNGETLMVIGFPEVRLFTLYPERL